MLQLLFIYLGLLVEIDSSQSSNENSDIASQSRLQSSKINGTGKTDYLGNEFKDLCDVIYDEKLC